MDEVFRALSDPSRRRLLNSLNSRNGRMSSLKSLLETGEVLPAG